MKLYLIQEGGAQNDPPLHVTTDMFKDLLGISDCTKAILAATPLVAIRASFVRHHTSLGPHIFHSLLSMHIWTQPAHAHTSPGQGAGEGEVPTQVPCTPVYLALVDATGGGVFLELIKGAVLAALEALPACSLFGLATFSHEVSHACTHAIGLGGSCLSAVCCGDL